MLDLQTLTFASVIATTVSTIFFVVIWRLNKHIAGVNIWLAAMFMQPVSWALLSFRTHVSDFMSIIVGNYLILASLLLFYIGVRAHLEKRTYLKEFLIGYTLIFLPIHLYFTYIEYNVVFRIYLVYCVSISIMLLSAYTLITLPDEKKTTGTIVYKWVAGMIALLSAFRLLTATGDIAGLYDLGISNFLGALLGFLIPQGMAMGVFILAYEKREAKIAALQSITKQEADLKSRYLATLSHELRTPLNGMVGIAQNLLANTKKEHDKNSLRTIINSGTHLAEVTNQVLEYATLEEQNITANMQETNVHKLISETHQLMSPSANEKQIKLSFAVDPAISDIVLLDHSKIRSILVNLVGNAIKYTSHGHVDIKVSLTADTLNKLQFSVIDTGSGIQIDDFQALLEPFARNKKDIHKQSGSGLGLYIVQTILSALGSKLQLNPNIKVGTHLFFNVDYYPRSAGYGVKDEQLSVNHLPSLNILLIEDIALNIKVVKSMLERHNHKVTTATTGAKAIQLLSEQYYDAILLDMQLPDMTGIDVFLKLTETKNHTANVIALTAAVTQEDLALYDEHNITRLVEKPVVEEKLLQSLSCIEADNQEPANKIKPGVIFFDLTLFDFLVKNLPVSELSQYVHTLPKQFDSDISDLIELITKTTDFSAACHKYSSYYGQFGLVQIQLQFKQLQNNPQLFINNKQDLIDSFNAGFNQLLEFYTEQHGQ